MGKINEVLNNIPLRISITDFCNLNCFFCSNEGMERNMKNTTAINLERLSYLLEILKKNGLKQVAITGGDPTCYPQLDKLLKKINSLNFETTFFHTNGVALNENLIKGELKRFSKIAVSIHTLDFSEWQKMTNGSKTQFDEILKNLEMLSAEGYSKKVEIKIVPIKGFNIQEGGIKNILDFCAKNNFRFKFLTFEPISEEHKKLVVDVYKIANMLENVGAQQSTQDKDFRGQKSYLPIKRYKYKNTEGVLIEIGCGKKDVCSSCANSNEIFVTPNLEIKPCHISPYLIPLDKLIINKDEDAVVNSILESRCFLTKSPGQNKEYWRQNE